MMFSERDLIFRVPQQSILDLARGGFARQVWVLSAEPEGQAEALDFLTKILAAARLNLEKDTLFVRLPAKTQVSILPALKVKHGEYILVFGLSPSDIGLTVDIPMYHPLPFYGTTFLFADALSSLEPDKALKSKLWQALQQMFL